MANYTVGERRNWRGEEYKGFKPTVYDWCRMAAFIDGEGHVQVNPYTGRTRGIMQCRVLISNTNPILPAWLKETFGGNIITLRRGTARQKKQIMWSCTAAQACWVLHNAIPWMLLKNQQAQLLFLLQDSMDGTRQGRGRRITEETADYRLMIKAQINALNKKGPAAVTSGI